MSETEALKKLFVSMPMRGKDTDDILIEYAEHVKRFADGLGGNYEVLIDHVLADFGDPEKDPRARVKYLASSIMEMADADIVYFAPGWADARGCFIEHDVCKAYGIPMVVCKRYHTEDTERTVSGT